MAGIGYNRCPKEEWSAAVATVGINGKTGKPIEINVNGVSAAISIHAALMSLTAAMHAGHEEDFLDKIVITLTPRIIDDPHILCPMLTVLSKLLLLVQGHVEVSFGEDERVQIGPEEEPNPPSMCLFDEEEEGDTDEEDGGDDYGQDGGGDIPGTNKEETSEDEDTGGGLYLPI